MAGPLALAGFIPERCTTNRSRRLNYRRLLSSPLAKIAEDPGKGDYLTAHTVLGTLTHRSKIRCYATGPSVGWGHHHLRFV